MSTENSSLSAQYVSNLADQVGASINHTVGQVYFGDPDYYNGKIAGIWNPNAVIPGSQPWQQPAPQIFPKIPKTRTVSRPAPLTKEKLMEIIADMLAELKKMSELASRFANANGGPVLVFDPKDGKLKLQDRQGRVYVERELFSFDGLEEIELPDWADFWDQPIVGKLTTTTADNTSPPVWIQGGGV